MNGWRIGTTISAVVPAVLTHPARRSSAKICFHTETRVLHRSGLSALGFWLRSVGLSPSSALLVFGVCLGRCAWTLRRLDASILRVSLESLHGSHRCTGPFDCVARSAVAGGGARAHFPGVARQPSRHAEADD